MRPLQLWRLWRRSVFRTLQLLQLALIFRWALRATYSTSPDILLNIRGEGTTSMEEENGPEWVEQQREKRMG